MGWPEDRFEEYEQSVQISPLSLFFPEAELKQQIIHGIKKKELGMK